MKGYLQSVQNINGWLLALASVLTAGQLRAGVAEVQAAPAGLAAVTVTAGSNGATASAGGAAGGENGVVIKAIEPLAGDEPLARKERPWLGVAIEEASEALASQLGLAPAVGLLVTYVAPDSPAAKAGLQKNDVLVEFEGQALVLPAQLRKLVQVRKEGDTVQLVFYRTGKKQTASATLGKAPAAFGSLEDEQAWKGDLSALSRQLRNLPIGDAIRDQMKVYRDSFGHLKIDQQKVQEEVRRSIEEARKAWEEAVRSYTNAASTAAGKALKELQRSGLLTDNRASLTVRDPRTKSIVHSDDAGIFVIGSNPKPRLTAHDKDGKLLFDGEIDTPEQRAKVPPELWEKVEPLLDKLTPKAEAEPETQPAPSKGPASRHDRAPAPTTGRVAPTL